jgi:hypothetical protein
MPLTQLDAFMLPCVLGDVGIPWTGLHVFEPFDAGDDAFGAFIARQRVAYQALAPEVAAMLADVDQRLTRNGLPPPPRPSNFEQYVIWNDVVILTMTTSVGPKDPERALTEVGRSVGELAQDLAIREVVVRLQEIAPTNEALRAVGGQYEARSIPRLQWLDKLQAFSRVPDSARPSAQRFAILARRVVELELVGIRPHDCEGIVNAIGAEIANLRGVLGG